MVDPNDLVVAHKASSPSEAEVVCTVLQDAGIYAMIPDQNNPLLGIDMTPFDGEYVPMGCIVLVSGERLKEAKTVIEEARAAGRLLAEGGD
jgi:hypothetical protein